jgi:hypothetical protein
MINARSLVIVPAQNADRETGTGTQFVRNIGTIR